MPVNLPHPCCGCMPLQKAVKYCAIVKAALEGICVIPSLCAILWMYVGAAVSSALKTVGADTSELDTMVYLTLACSILIILFIIIQVVLAVGLFFAAGKRDVKRCKIWIIVSFTLSVLCCILAFVSIVGFGEWNCAIVVPALYTIYMVYVVYAFTEEVKKETAGVPAFAVMQPATVYGQPSQGTLQQSQYNQPSPPAYGGSPSSAPSHQSTREV